MVILTSLSGCQNSRTASRNAFSSLSDEELFEAASQLSRNPETADSAILCFAVLSDRLQNDGESEKSKELQAKTLTNLGYLFSNFRFDYQKAYSYLSQALDICNRAGLDSIKPYIYLDMAVTTEAFDSLRQHHEMTDSIAERRLSDALRMAGKTRQWRPYKFAFHNLATIYTSRYDTLAASRLLKHHAGLNKLPNTSEELAFTDSIANALSQWIAGSPLEAAATFNRLAKEKRKGELQNKEIQYSVIGMSADMYNAAGQPDKANVILTEMAREIEANGNAGSRKWITSRMYENYKAKGDSAMADAWRLKLYIANEELQSQVTVTPLDGLEFLSKMRAIQDDIAAERAHKKKMSAVIIFLSIFYAAAFLLLSLYARRAYKRRRHVQKLYQEVIKAVNSRRESSGNEIDPALMRNIRQILDNSPSVLKADFSLTTLARETGSNTTYVSNAINSGFGQSFSTLVAKRRIDEACIMLQSREFDNLTVEAIAEKVGIKSRSNFSALFKKIAGMTPTEFRNASKKR